MGHETQEAAPPTSQEAAPGMPRTRLLEHRARRSDDARLVALIRELPATGSPRCEVFRMGVLNEAGELYREVRLSGEYEEVLFTARMNAGGFIREMPAEWQRAEGFAGVFAKR